MGERPRERVAKKAARELKIKNRTRKNIDSRAEPKTEEARDGGDRQGEPE